MFGKNPKRKPIKSDGSILDVQEIFATIQGEGSNVGKPSVFIRLGGCNLACNFCDTEFENFSQMAVENILKQTIKLSKNFDGKIVRNLVVITGGEPFRQNIIPLCNSLLKNKYKVQIETNGTLFLDLPKEVEIICSPKNNNGLGYKKIRSDLLERINAFKFIISKDNKNYNFVPEVGQSDFNIPVYIQPMDEYNKGKNKANLDYTKNLALEQGYIISLQTHKIMGIA
jgi:organic radical activating enzyme